MPPFFGKKNWAKKISEKVEKKEQDKVEAPKKVITSFPESETKNIFEKVKEKIQKIKISEKEFDIYSEELEMLLLENNVALEVAEEIISKLKTEIIGKEF